MTKTLVFPQTMDGIMDKPGMTLRDWFAGQALAGIASDPDVDISIYDRAKWSYRMADAMLAYRDN